MSHQDAHRWATTTCQQLEELFRCSFTFTQAHGTTNGKDWSRITVRPSEAIKVVIIRIEVDVAILYHKSGRWIGIPITLPVQHCAEHLLANYRLQIYGEAAHEIEFMLHYEPEKGPSTLWARLAAE